jgi:site-specific recombinase XerD
LPLSEAIDGFTLACQARKLSPHTLADYGRTLRRFLAHVGDMPIGDITIAQVSAFLAAQPFSEKTVKNYHIGLAALWTWAIRQGHITRHIIRLIDKPRPQKTVIEPLSQVEVKRILDAAQAGRNAARNRSIILLLLDTGLRASELINITLADIDFARRLIKVLGKGNKERLLPFSKRTGQAIFGYMYPLDGLTRLYPMNRESLAHLTARLGQAAGIRGGVHPHRFRHTFAVTYLRNGGDPYTLQEILGHSTFEMVRHYLALAQIDLETAHNRASPVENWQL